jgi:hypothetical protein
MKTKNIEKYLDSFGKYVVQQSKSNLTKAKKNVSSNLYNSIKFKVAVTKRGFSVDFYMLDYGTFVDKGVSGNKKIQNFINYDGKKVESPFKYKSRMPPTDILAKWISARRIKGRSEKTGRFISNKSLAYIFARKIKRDGIRSTSFFQKPLALAIKRFGVGMLNAVKEDVVTMFSDQFKTSIE